MSFPVRNPLSVFCADIGSVSGGNFGWFGRLTDETTVQGTDIAALASAVAGQMNLGGGVALGFEAPMFVPLRTDPLELTKRRVGETNPNWIGGPGSAVLATGLAQVPWILRDVKSRLSVIGRATLVWKEFASGGANLFLWEAFVSGHAKGDSHIRDAQIAVGKFEECLPDPTPFNVITEATVTSLVGAAMLRTAWSDDVSLLGRPCVVIKA